MINHQDFETFLCRLVSINIYNKQFNVDSFLPLSLKKEIKEDLHCFYCKKALTKFVI